MRNLIAVLMMFGGWILLVGTLIAVAILPGCESGIEILPERDVSIREGSDIEVPAFTWRVRTQAELQAEWEKATGDKLGPAKVEGFTAVDESGRLLVYTQQPSKVDGSETVTLGHEVMHLVLGEYHPVYKANKQ